MICGDPSITLRFVQDDVIICHVERSRNISTAPHSSLLRPFRIAVLPPIEHEVHIELQGNISSAIAHIEFYKDWDPSAQLGMTNNMSFWAARNERAEESPITKRQEVQSFFCITFSDIMYLPKGKHDVSRFARRCLRLSAQTIPHSEFLIPNCAAHSALRSARDMRSVLAQGRRVHKCIKMRILIFFA